MTTAKRRARRIAADEAHAWARNLRLGNVHAKLILSMLSLYVDGDGFAFVGIGALADDCELSADTVRRRLALLEELGVLVRHAQWIDARGRRNGDGQGKRTTDLIQLLMDADQDDIEARAAGENVPKTEAVSTSISPSQQPGLTEPQNPIGPRLGLGQPLHCGEGLISEPEPESPPKDPPPGGVRADDQDSILEEPEHFAEFWRGYPNHEVMSRYRALEVFVAMTAAERKHARAAVPELASALARAKRRPRDAYKWLADKGWNEFPKAIIAAAPAASQRRMIKSAELAAVQVALRMSGRSALPVVGSTQGGEDGGFWGRPAGADLLAMAEFARDDQRDWQFVADGSQSCAAWRARLSEWIGTEIPLARRWLEDFDEAVHGGMPSSNPNFRMRKSENGLFVPRPFPPRRDGGWADDNGEAA